MDFEIWKQRAIYTISQKILINQKFTLKGLFKECEWCELKKGERISFGKYFANEVREGRINGVVPVERLKNNHSRYQKVDF